MQDRLVSFTGILHDLSILNMQDDGTIDLGLAPYVERVAESKNKNDIIILKINTFGGRVDGAVRIRDALLKSKATTIAFYTEYRGKTYSFDLEQFLVEFESMSKSLHYLERVAVVGKWLKNALTPAIKKKFSEKDFIIQELNFRGGMANFYTNK